MTQTIAWEDTLEGLAAERNRWLVMRAPEAYRCGRCKQPFPFMCVTLTGLYAPRAALSFHKARITTAEQDEPRVRLEKLRAAYVTAGAPAGSPYAGYVRSLNRILAVWGDLPQ